MSLENRIENFIMIMRESQDFLQINGTYHSIKATLNDYKKYGQPYNKKEVNRLLPKMEINYREWQNKMEKIKENPETKKRKYPQQLIIIKTLKNSKNKQ